MPTCYSGYWAGIFIFIDHKMYVSSPIFDPK